MEDLKQLYDAILVGNFKLARETTEKALAAKTDPQELVQKYMIPAMDEVGRRYEANEYFVPELLIAARAMKASLELIRPLLIARGDKYALYLNGKPTAYLQDDRVQGDKNYFGFDEGTKTLDNVKFWRLEPSPAAEATMVAKPVAGRKVCVVDDLYGSVDDNGYTESAWKGVQDAMQKLGVKVIVPSPDQTKVGCVENRKEAEQEANLQAKKKAEQEWATLLRRHRYTSIAWLLERVRPSEQSE